MFELVRFKRSANPLLTSLLIHSLAAMALFTLHFTGAFSAIVEHLQPVSLIAPQAPKVPPPLPPRSPRSAPRPPIAPLPTIALELPAPVLIESPPAVVVVPRVPPAVVAVAVAAAAPAPAPATPPAPRPVIKAAGFSAAESSPQGPPRGSISAGGVFDTATGAERGPADATAARSRVSGFGDNSTPAPAPSARRPVATATFGDTSIAAADPPATAKPSAPASFTPVEILNKPRPRYSEEARRLQVEGEVLVELLFAATGESRVLRVVRGLGHGLDENAIAAAREIRFRPARRGGGPVDSAAVVHIIFQLAY